MLEKCTSEVRKKGGVTQGRKNAESGHMARIGSQLYEDPSHPELGHHNAGNLVRKQKANGYPHGPENRVKVTKEGKT